MYVVINEELFCKILGCNIVGLFFVSVMAHLLCREVLIFGLRDTNIWNLQLLCGDVVVFYCGVTG